MSTIADAARGLMHGVGLPVAGPVVQTLLWAAAIVVIFGPLSVWAFERKV